MAGQYWRLEALCCATGQ